MRGVLVLFVVLACVYRYTEACSCLPQHPQVQFCGSDFVIKARILKRTRTGPTQRDEVIYTVKILKDYKNHRRLSLYGPNTQEISTAANSALCGSFFEIDKEYLISGSISNGKWRTNLCSWNVQFPSLTPYQRDALKFGYYKKNCRCEIQQCFGNSCPPAAPNTCVIKKGANFTCFYQQNSCSRQSYGCGWRTKACL
ncbi:metalloproteinase inhibitor 3-like [Crassostrea virginica]